MSVHRAALLRNPELVAQIEADQVDLSRAIRSEARSLLIYLSGFGTVRISV